MTTKEQYLLETWPKQQARGKFAYLAFHALFYGIVTSAISLLFNWGDAPIMDLLLTKDAIVRLAIFITIGIALANFKWKTNNRKYEELERQQAGK